MSFVSFNNTMDSLYNSYDDIPSTGGKKLDMSIGDALMDFEKLRISALTNAAEISPQVKEVTIGPRSPLKKDEPRSVSPPKKQQDLKENLIEDKLRDDLRYTLIMKKYESQLQENSDEIFKNLIEKMIDNRAKTMRKYWKKQSKDCQQKALEIKERKLQMLKELKENDNMNLLEKAKLDEQRSQVITKQAIDNMNRILEEQNKATARFAAVTDSHTKICICYNDITSLMQTHNTDADRDIINKYIASISSVVKNINIVMDFCKKGAITDKEVKQADILAVNIENIKQKIIEDLNQRLQQDQLNKQKKEEEALRIKQQKEKEEQKVQEANTAIVQEVAKPNTEKTQPVFFSNKNYQYYQDLKEFLEQYENQYKELLENPNLKKFRFDCQKAVNTPVNAISSVSGMHIKDKFDKLSKLLRGERVQVLDTQVAATSHPQGLSYCTALLAKKIVRQGDLLVSSNPEAAFPLAALTVTLWTMFPEFGKLLEGYFHRMCPYLVPMVLPQNEGQTDKEFYLSRGYIYNDEGMVEKQDKFLKRMSGIFRLRCAIWIAKTPRFVNAPNPHSLQHGWRWLASFINLKPEPELSATLLHDFFTVCGSEFYKYYGKQFTKIIQLISCDYFAILENIDEGGPKDRLEVYLQNVLKTGHIPPPEGLLQPNTW